MAVLPIETWIEWAKIAQFLSASDRSTIKNLSNGNLRSNLPRLIMIVRKAIEFQYNNNPTDPSLYATSTYMYQLISGYVQQAQQIQNNLNASTITIMGPASITTNVGVSATFSVTASGGTPPYTYQWNLAGVPIVGATGSAYTVTNPQTGQSGEVFTCLVTDSAGKTALSTPATLTVINAQGAAYWYGTTDPYPALSGGSDTLPYQGTTPLTPGQPIVIPWPTAAANGQYQVVKYIATESTKVQAFIPPLDTELIPGDNYQSVLTLNGFKYIITRRPISLSISNTNVTYS